MPTHLTRLSVSAALLSVVVPLAAEASAGKYSFLRHAELSILQPMQAGNDILRRAPGERPQLRSALACAVRGTPVEFPNDIVIWPQSYWVPAGTIASWSVPGSIFHGTVALPSLSHGQSFFVSNAIPGGLPAETPCTVTMQ